MNPSRTWRKLCQIAFLESDPRKLGQKIRDARQAIAARHGADDMTPLEAEDLRRAVEVLDRRESSRVKKAAQPSPED